MKLNPATKVIILNSLISDEIEWDLFRTGIRGCCRGISNPTSLKLLSRLFNKGNYGFGER